jgi:hypothetical protein
MCSRCSAAYITSNKENSVKNRLKKLSVRAKFAVPLVAAFWWAGVYAAEAWRILHTYF